MFLSVPAEFPIGGQLGRQVGRGALQLDAVLGSPGTGKTALVLHLVESSLRGQRGERNESGSLNTAPPGKYLYSLNLIHFNLRSQIIAMDNSICLVIAKVT